MWVYSLPRCVCWVVFLSVTSSQVCVPVTSTHFSVSLSTGRNATGHWVIKSHVTRQDPPQDTMEGKDYPRNVVLKVGHKAEQHEGSQIIKVTLTTTLGSTVMPGTMGQRSPPAGYELMNGVGYYKVYHTPMTWEEARLTCEQEGAHLIVIDSDLETEVVRALFSRRPKFTNYANPGHFYIGVSDQLVEGYFVTVLGDPLYNTGYARWQPGQPDGGTSQNCVSVFESLLWVDGSCSHHVPFICEYNIW